MPAVNPPTPTCVPHPRNPGDPVGERGPSDPASRGEHRAELLLEQVGAVEPVVGLGDDRERGALLAGEVPGVLQLLPSGCL